jgi:hypothetical protein
MRIFCTIILTFNLYTLHGQITQTKADTNQNIKEFKNQGEQEDSWAIQLFEKNYSKQIFKKYKGDIFVNGDTIKYSNFSILAFVPTKFKLIFSSGILYPEIIMSLGPSKIYAIGNFEEQFFLENSTTHKRFKFWLTRKELSNPVACFIELTNQSATDKTYVETFIKGASLTFYKEGWLII